MCKNSTILQLRRLMGCQRENGSPGPDLCVITRHEPDFSGETFDWQMATKVPFNRSQGLAVHSMGHRQVRNYLGKSTVIGLESGPGIHQGFGDSFKYFCFVGVQIGSRWKPPNFRKGERKRLNRHANVSQNFGFPENDFRRTKGVKQSDVRRHTMTGGPIVLQSQRCDDWFNLGDRYDDRRFISHATALCSQFHHRRTAAAFVLRRLADVGDVGMTL